MGFCSKTSDSARSRNKRFEAAAATRINRCDSQPRMQIQIPQAWKSSTKIQITTWKVRFSPSARYNYRLLDPVLLLWARF